MSELKPNHICKNVNCKKQYYACDYCGKTQNWRSMACSNKCYGEYMKQIEEARKNNLPVDLYPQRTDMTHAEVAEMVNNAPLKDVKEKTMAELYDYKDDIEAIGLGGTIDKINAELEKSQKPKPKRKTTKV